MLVLQQTLKERTKTSDGSGSCTLYIAFEVFDMTVEGDSFSSVKLVLRVSQKYVRPFNLQRQPQRR